MGRWIVHIWPGLARIDRGAEVSGLLLAMLFTVGLNFLLATTFVWHELMAPKFLAAFWLMLGVFWLVCVVTNVRRDSYFRSLAGAARTQDLFSAANKEYLQGRFKQSRDILQRLIDHNPRDAEARLLLTTIATREGRFEDCDRQLRQMQRLSSAAVWSAEIRQQWKRIEQLRPQTD